MGWFSQSVYWSDHIQIDCWPGHISSVSQSVTSVSLHAPVRTRQFSLVNLLVGHISSVQFSQFTGQDTAVQFSQLTSRVTSVQFSQSVQSIAVDTPMSRQFCQRTGQVTTVQLSSVQSESQAFQRVGVCKLNCYSLTSKLTGLT